MILILSGSAIAKLMLVASGSILFLNSFIPQEKLWVVSNKDNVINTGKNLSYITNTNNIHNTEILKNKGVVVDLENWRFTPKNQKKNPIQAVKSASHYIEKNNLTNWLMAAPSMNLIREIYPTYKGKVYLKFIQENIAGKIAPYVKAYDIQAQGAENNPLYYKQIIKKITRQLHDSNKNIKIFAELNITKNSNNENKEKILEDIRNTQKYVSGYWIAVPDGSHNKVDKKQINTALQIIRYTLSKKD